MADVNEITQKLISRGIDPQRAAKMASIVLQDFQDTSQAQPLPTGMEDEILRDGVANARHDINVNQQMSFSPAPPVINSAADIPQIVNMNTNDLRDNPQAEEFLRKSGYGELKGSPLRMGKEGVLSDQEGFPGFAVDEGEVPYGTLSGMEDKTVNEGLLGTQWTQRPGETVRVELREGGEPVAISDNLKRWIASPKGQNQVKILKKWHSQTKPVSQEVVLNKIKEYADKYQIDPTILLSIAIKESNVNPNVLHDKNAGYGLFGLLTMVHPVNNKQNPFDIDYQIDMAAKRLRSHMDKTNDLNKAIQMWNPGSKGYADRVLANVDKARSLLGIQQQNTDGKSNEDKLKELRQREQEIIAKKDVEKDQKKILSYNDELIKIDKQRRAISNPPPEMPSEGPDNPINKSTPENREKVVDSLNKQTEEAVSGGKVGLIKKPATPEIETKPKAPEAKITQSGPSGLQIAIEAINKVHDKYNDDITKITNQYFNDRKGILKNIDELRNRYEAQQELYQHAKVDPQRLFKNSTAAANILRAIGVGLGSASQALARSQGFNLPNNALDLWNKAIDRDINLQLEEIKRKGEGIKGTENLLADQYKKLGDLRLAMLSSKKIMLDSLQTKVQHIRDVTGLLGKQKPLKQLPDKKKAQISQAKLLMSQWASIYNENLRGNSFWEYIKSKFPWTTANTRKQLAGSLATQIAGLFETGKLTDQDTQRAMGWVPKPGDTDTQLKDKMQKFLNFMITSINSIVDEDSYPGDIYDRRALSQAYELRDQLIGLQKTSELEKRGPKR